MTYYLLEVVNVALDLNVVGIVELSSTEVSVAVLVVLDVLKVDGVGLEVVEIALDLVGIVVSVVGLTSTEVSVAALVVLDVLVGVGLEVVEIAELLGGVVLAVLKVVGLGVVEVVTVL